MQESNSSEPTGVDKLGEEIRSLQSELSEIKALLKSAVIRPQMSYLDNPHRDRIIYVLRTHLEYSFNEICGILPLIYPEWRFSSKAISEAFYRYRKKHENHP